MEFLFICFSDACANPAAVSQGLPLRLPAALLQGLPHRVAAALPQGSSK